MHPLNAGEMEFVFRSVCQKRKIGRVIECAGLEIRYTHCGYRGFESLIFRFSFSKNEGQVFVSHFFCFVEKVVCFRPQKKHLCYLSDICFAHTIFFIPLHGKNCAMRFFTAWLKPVYYVQQN